MAHLPLVVIGHVGLATDHTVTGTKVAVGGSGYAVAAAAAALFDEQVGLAAQMGTDLEPAVLRGTGLNLDGVAVLPGRRRDSISINSRTAPAHSSRIWGWRRNRVSICSRNPTCMLSTCIWGRCRRGSS